MVCGVRCVCVCVLCVVCVVCVVCCVLCVVCVCVVSECVVSECGVFRDMAYQQCGPAYAAAHAVLRSEAQSLYGEWKVLLSYARSPTSDTASCLRRIPQRLEVMTSLMSARQHKYSSAPFREVVRWREEGGGGGVGGGTELSLAVGAHISINIAACRFERSF